MGSGGASANGGAAGKGMGGTSGGGQGGNAGSTPAADALVGAFLIELKPPAGGEPAQTTLQGKVSDGPTPSTLVLELTQQSGDCKLLTPKAPFCSPKCTGSDLCVGENKCAAYPTSQNLGNVEVRGLGPAPFTMEPIANNYQLPVDVTLPFPPAAEGAEVQVLVKGGPYGAFTLATKMVAPLAWTETLVLDRNKPIALTWTAPGKADVGRMEIRVEISHHGGSKGEINCNVADNGSFSVPAELVTKLIDLGVAGFPTVTLTRTTMGTMKITPGIVNLQVLSPIVREVTVAGFTSCDEDHPCPGGKTCQDNKVCPK
jgi:hypothetical protein